MSMSSISSEMSLNNGNAHDAPHSLNVALNNDISGRSTFSYASSASSDSDNFSEVVSYASSASSDSEGVIDVIVSYANGASSDSDIHHPLQITISGPRNFNDSRDATSSTVSEFPTSQLFNQLHLIDDFEPEFDEMRVADSGFVSLIGSTDRLNFVVEDPDLRFRRFLMHTFEPQGLSQDRVEQALLARSQSVPLHFGREYYPQLLDNRVVGDDSLVYPEFVNDVVVHDLSSDDDDEYPDASTPEFTHGVYASNTTLHELELTPPSGPGNSPSGINSEMADFRMAPLHNVFLIAYIEGEGIQTLLQSVPLHIARRYLSEIEYNALAGANIPHVDAKWLYMSCVHMYGIATAMEHFYVLPMQQNILVDQNADTVSDVHYPARHSDADGEFVPQMRDIVQQAKMIEASLTNSGLGSSRRHGQSGTSKKSNAYISMEKRAGKRRSITRKLMRFAKYQPQMRVPFSVGLDESTQSVVDDVVAAVNGLTQSISSAHVSVDLAVPSLEQFGSNIFDKITSTLKTPWAVALAILALAFILKRTLSPVVQRLISILVSLCAAYYIGNQYFTPFFESLSAWLDRQEDAQDDQFEEQGLFDYSGAIMTAVIYLCYGELLKTDYKSFTDLFAKFERLRKAKDGIEFTFEFVIKSIRDFAMWIGKDNILLRNMPASVTQRLTQSVMEFTDELRKGGEYNYDNAIRLFELEREINNSIAALPNTREFAEEKKALVALAASLKPLISRMERNNVFANGPRHEPLGVMIGGPTAVGKSTGMYPLLLRLMGEVLPDNMIKSFIANHNDLIWNFIPENPFHDAYHGQWCTTMDEAGAQRDVAGTPDPGALAVLRMLNHASFPLHMAHLEDKGHANFTSRLLWATTNRRKFEWKSMYSTEAYTRRFKQSWLMVPCKEYCKEGTITDDLWDRRMDESKIPPCDDGFDMTVSEYYPYNFLTGQVVGSPVSYEELITILVNAFKTTMAKNEKLFKFHESQKQVALAKRGYTTQGADDEEDGLFPRISNYFAVKLSAVRELAQLMPERVSLWRDNLTIFWTDFAATFMLPVQSGLSSIISLLKKVVQEHPVITAVLATIPACLLLYKLLNAAFDTQSDISKPNPKSGKAKGRVASRRVVQRNRGKVSKLEKSIGMFDQQALMITRNFDDLSKSLWQRNIYAFRIDSSKEIQGYVIFVEGRLALSPGHFFDNLSERALEDPNLVLTFSRCSSLESGFSCRFNDIDFFSVEGAPEDHIFWNFPKVVHSHRSIVKHFVPENSHIFKDKFYGAMLTVSDKFSEVPDRLRMLHASFVQCLPKKNFPYGQYVADNAFSYPLPTAKGDCGAPLLTCDDADPRPMIAGIHVAGNGSTGVSIRITREDIELALDSCPQEVEVQFRDLEPTELKVEPKYQVIGKAENLPVPSKSVLSHSPVCGAWGEPKTAPALLHPTQRDGKVIDPWVNARSKYGKTHKAFDIGKLNRIADLLAAHMIHVSASDRSPRVYTYEEAVKGIPGCHYFRGIPRGTSLGHPRSLHTKLGGKKDYWGSEGEYEMNTPLALQLQSEVALYDSLIKKGKRSLVAYADYLKDERRPIAKVLAGKTRLISASPVDLLISSRRYFGDFVRWIMENRVNNSCGLGINPYQDWETVIGHLHSVSDNIIAGDFGSYDGSLSPSLQYAALRVIEAYYHNSTAEERKARSVLFEEIVNSIHVATVPGGSVYTEWLGGGPSGSFLTTPVNCLINLILTLYVVTEILEDAGFVYDDIFELLASIVFGDDNVHAVHDSIKHLVTQETLTNKMAKYGFEYTPEDKGEHHYTHRPITQCTFLKRGFMYNDHAKRHVAPLAMETILEMPYWVRKGRSSDTVITARTAVLELSLHGPEAFSLWAPKIISAVRESCGELIIPNTYEECVWECIHLDYEF